eukprot:7131039-Pyramimonas_sp.AAC.1
MSWTYVMDLCHGPMSWTYVMDQCHEPMPSPLTRLVLFKGVVKYIDLCHQPPFLSGGALLYDSAANAAVIDQGAEYSVDVLLFAASAGGEGGQGGRASGDEGRQGEGHPLQIE